MNKVVVTLAATLWLGGGSAQAAPIRLDVQLGGGSVLAWDASSETGNSIGGLVLMGLGDFSFGIGGLFTLMMSMTAGPLWAMAALSNGISCFLSPENERATKVAPAISATRPLRRSTCPI